MKKPLDFRALLAEHKMQISICSILLATLAAFMISSPETFLGPRIYVAYMSTIPFSAIIALGMTLLIVSGEIDLSFPSVMAVSGLAFAWTYTESGNGWLALLLALLAGAGAGYVNAFIVVRIGVPSIIATIGTQFFWRGIAMILSDGLALNLVEVRGTPIHSLFVGRLGQWIPAQAVWCVAIAVCAWLLLNRHTFGDGLRFVGDNSETARMMGIAVGRVKTMAFVLMGLLTALAGTMVCLEMANWWPTQGEGYLLLVFASVFVGGTSVFGGEGTVFGTFIGAVIIGIIEAGIISAGLAGFWTRTIYGIIVVVSVSIHATMLGREKR